MQSVKYRLKKPLPDSKVGDIYIQSDSGEYYYKSGNNEDSYWMKVNVENNPEWFELIEPIPSPPTTIDTICNEVGKMINEQQSNYIISVYLKNEISKLIEKSKPQDTFTWTDGRVKEFVKYYNDLDGFVFGADPIGETIQSWKQSKAPIPKEENTGTKKPPLGIIPLWLHREQRLDEINDAIGRYEAVGKDCPKEWLAEAESLESFLQDESNSKYKTEEKKERVDMSNDDLVGLLRDCVSETWGNTSLDRTQELFDDFLVKRNLVNRSAKQLNKLISGMVNEILLDKKYTQSDIDKAREETWEASRLVHPLAGMKYDTLPDYLQTIKSNRQ